MPGLGPGEDQCLAHMRREKFIEKGGLEKNEEQAGLSDRSFKLGMSNTLFLMPYVRGSGGRRRAGFSLLSWRMASISS